MTGFTWLGWSRRLALWLGMASLLLTAMAGDDASAGRFANLTLIFLAIAVAVGWVESFRETETPARVGSADQSRNWLWAASGVTAFTILAAQRWFQPGLSIAGGDITPPNGAAWMSRLFSEWSWSGSNLGGPSAIEQQLPWAVTLNAIQWLGGSPDEAQRVWYTALFAGAALAAFALFRVLGMRPVGAAVGAIAYIFSPWVLGNATPNPVYLATLAMLPALPAVVLATAKGQLRIRSAVILLGVSSPMLGYVDMNPPLLGLVTAAFVIAPVAALWLYGASASRRSLLLLALGLPTVLALSAYWIVPSVIQLVDSVPTGFAPISSWAWTEGRATIGNALWLNTAWGWAHQEYFPFAPYYDVLPLSLLKFGPAFLAFGALAFNPRNAPASADGSRFRLTVLAASIALALIFLSTGTNPPGSFVFDRLYALPLGWLLREPGRFLIAADLMYAVLIALTLDGIVTWLGSAAPFVTRRAALNLATPLAIALVVITPGLPLITGAALPDKRPTLPGWHVSMPAYWTEMASFIDATSTPGALLVLPPDDFYQMPYRWGYYGNDGFIMDLVHRHVLVPSPQGYFPASPQLLSAVNLTSQSIYAGDWPMTDRILRALGAGMLLVRGDLDISFPGRSFASPATLDQALQGAPDFYLMHAAGPLHLYGLIGAHYAEYERASYYATVSAASPDLRVLSRLPESAALVVGPPRAGIPVLIQVPSVARWKAEPGSLSWSFPERAGFAYDLVHLDSEMAPESIIRLITEPPRVGALSVSRSAEASGGNTVSISLADHQALTNGDFLQGSWGPVADCAAFNPASKPYLTAVVPETGGPNGGRFLRLSAYVDSACVSRELAWSGGSLILSMSVRRDIGGDPRICLWESGPDRCASLAQPTAVVGQGWTMYNATVTPDRGTSALSLFLYADADAPYTLTQIDYTDIQALEVVSLPQLDVLGTPVGAPKPPTLMIHNSSYSPNWQGPAGSDHVVVDGLSNGWIVVNNSSALPQYRADPIRTSFGLSIAGALVVLGLALSAISWRHLSTTARRVRLGRHPR